MITITSSDTTTQAKSFIEKYERGKRCEMRWNCVFEFGR